MRTGLRPLHSCRGEQSVAAQYQAAKAKLLELENGTRQERIAQQRAVVRQLQAELQAIDINLAKSILAAPYDGIVSQRFLDERTVIDAGEPIVELLETGSLDARVGMSDDVVARLDRGATHEVVVDGKPYSAIVRSVRPDRNQVTRTVSVLFALDVGKDLVHVGDLATVRVENHVAESGYWLPISALTESYRGLWGCYVAVPSESGVAQSAATHTLQLRQLEVIHQTSESAFVRGSLKDGEAVVSNGIQRLVPRQFVKLAARSALSKRNARKERDD